MGRIGEVFLKTKPFIAYITAGDPDLRATFKFARKLERAGVDILELGIPFSDSLADGPVIQESHRLAIAKGVSLPKIMEQVKRFRKHSKLPIIFMGAANLFLAYGLKTFFADAREAGVDGLIIPDLPPEEARDFIYLSEHYSLDLIFLASTQSSNQRLELIAKASKAFVYLISSTGLTGERKDLEYDQIRDTITKLKMLNNELPVAVGFGISEPEQAKSMFAISDGIIVGSAIVSRMQKSLGLAEKFVKKLIKAGNEK